MGAMLEGRDLIGTDDLSVDQIAYLMRVAEDMYGSPRRMAICNGKVMVYLFYEPSTRTRMSFQTAMLRLGGDVVGFGDPRMSSVAKGESLSDTVRIVQHYGDIIVIRHPLEGAARVAADHADIPVINGGDGAHEHPSQGLAALFTILQKGRELQGLRVGLCGDLKFGRTVHSFVDILARFEAQTVCIAPTQLQIPNWVLEKLRRNYGYEVTRVDDLSEAIEQLDVLYMTRLQRERLESEEEYLALKGSYGLTPRLLERASKDLLIMHPLPRLDEIPPVIDSDPRAIYFEQAGYSVPVRMALIASLLGAVRE